MRQLVPLLLAGLLLWQGNALGQCPERMVLRDRINFLKGTTISFDDQATELSPYVARLEACRRPADSVFALLLQRLGILHYFKKDFPAAEHYTRRAIRILDEECPPTAVKPALLVKWYNYLHLIYDSLHQKKEELAAIDSSVSIAIRTATVDRFVVHILWEKTGYCYDIGDYGRCYTNVLLGQTLCRQYLSGPDSLHYVRGFLTHAFNALHQLGRYDEEEILLKTRIGEFAVAKDTAALGAFLNQLAVVYQQKHDYRQALDCLQRSYDWNKLIHYQQGCAEALNNRGYIYLRFLKDYPRSINLCRSALACLPSQRTPGSPESLEALNEYDNIACAYTARGRLDSAFVYFQLAFDQLGPGMNEIRLLNSEGNNLYDKEKTEYLAQLIVDKGDAFYEQYLLTHTNKALSESIRIYKMADLFLERAKKEQAERLSQLAFRKNARVLYEHAIRSAIAAANAGDAFYFFERSRAILLNDQLQEQAALDDKALADRAAIRKKILRLDNELRLLAPDAEGYAKLQTTIFSTRQELDRFDQTSRTPTATASTLTTIPTLQQHLKKDQQSFLELYAGDSAVYSLLVTPNSVSLKTIDKIAFDSLGQSYSNYIADPDRLNRDMPGFTRTAYQLYRLLFPTDSVPSGRFIISPASTYFPFEALVTNSSARKPVYFLEEHPICYTYSARYFLDTTGERPRNDREGPRPGGKEFMGIAPVQYAKYLQLPDLPGSNGSLDQIASWFGQPDKFTTVEASKASFLQNFSNYRLIQLYTHAVGNMPGKEPLIYFADSALALSELIPERKPFTRIIVLSACETANGEFFQGEGVFSFNREFAALGIPTAVVNLWSVDNMATYRVTELFYKYLSKGQPADIALQQAKKEFLHNASGDQRLPYYWAAPVLTGQATILPKSPASRSWLYFLLLPAALLIVGYFAIKKVVS